MDAKTLKAIQILAIKEIEDSNFGFFYKRVCRWFSEKFHTPLKEVEGYDDEYVLRTYFEETLYESHKSEDNAIKEFYNNFKNKILMTDAELQKDKEEEKTVEKMDDDWVQKMNQDIGTTSKSSPPDIIESYNIGPEYFDLYENTEESIQTNQNDSEE